MTRHRMLLQAAALVGLLTTSSIVRGFTIGEAPGFAAGTTGGGAATPDYPKTIEELTTLLGDDQPRVVVLDKEFDFLGTEGTTTETGCRPKSNTDCLAKKNGFAGQDVILFPGDTTLTNTGGCDQQVRVDVTYDNATKKYLIVKSNKTLRGISQAGVIKGKGLQLDGDNIIVQNVHITELNPQFVWGGDAIYIQGTEERAMKQIWLDHVKISRVGRQMFVSGFAGVESLTISNSDFDGRTDWSSSCDGRHYWGFILDGTTTRVSFLNNYIHSTSGRSPKIIGASSDSANVVAHIANNYWADNSGHSFEPGTHAFVLAEGNFFEDTEIPMQADANEASISTTDDCSAALGRACSVNVLEKSGVFDSVNGDRALETVKQYKEITGYRPGEATRWEKSLENYGIGILDDAGSASNAGQMPAGTVAPGVNYKNATSGSANQQGPATADPQTSVPDQPAGSANGSLEPSSSSDSDTQGTVEPAAGGEDASLPNSGSSSLESPTSTTGSEANVALPTGSQESDSNQGLGSTSGSIDNNTNQGDSGALTAIGEAPGFAAGTTGGGAATPDYPKTIEELTTLLGDDQPRVVVLDKEFDFLGTEGTTTETGCRPKSNTDCLAKKNGFAGQDVILFPGDTTLTNTGGCDQQVRVDVTYDNATKKYLIVKSNKTLRGIGQAGVIKGKGLQLDGDNIIVQNVHITELNPQFVWGGDAIYIQGTEERAMKQIWLDHVKISRVGRQMFVSGFAGVESLTISNSDFDGRTDWSSSCDGRHYWGFILDGTTTRVSFLNNFIHSTSGRSPKIIGASSDSANVVAHIANNYWADNSGHSFEPGTHAFVLAEGNFFEDTEIPMQADANEASISTTDDCSAALGRACSVNVLEKSGVFDSVNGDRALETVKQYKEITGYTPGEAIQLSMSESNFGVGELTGSPDSPAQGSVAGESVTQQSDVQGSVAKDFDPSEIVKKTSTCSAKRRS